MISDFWRLCLIAVTILGLDSIWLSFNKDIYMKTLTNIQGGAPLQFNMIGVVIAYVALILGAYVTTGLGSNIQIPLINKVFPNLLTKLSNIRVIATGFLFLIAYLVWNGTALAVFKDYTYKLAFIDTLWGLLLGLIVGYITQSL